MKKSKFIVLILLIFSFNLIWEFLHYGLYIDLTGIPSNIHLIIASFTDLILVLFIFLIISTFRKGITWIENTKKSDYIIIILLGMLIAILIEIYSITHNRWFYTEYMPTIFGIGISPLIQLFTTAIISLWLYQQLNFRKFFPGVKFDLSF